jgi:hypothetical protein
VKKAAEVLAQVLDEKQRKLGQAYSSIFTTWPQIVGDSMSDHSRVYEISNGYLFIEVDHPGWMQLLLMRKPRILNAVKRKVPAMSIRDLRVKVNLNYASTTREDEPPVEKGADEPEVGDPQGVEIDRILATVSQEELKKRLKRLFLKSLEKESSR